MKGVIKYILEDFSAIVIFLVFNRLYGEKVALVSFILITGLVVYIKHINKKPTTNFFKFLSVVTIIFGIVDLFLDNIVFIKYESAVSSMVYGAYFASSLVKKKPIIREFAQNMQLVKGEIPPDLESYFKLLTIIWVAYFFIKSAIYAFLAYNYSFGELVVMRGIYGTSSLYILLLISIFGKRFVK